MFKKTKSVSQSGQLETVVLDVDNNVNSVFPLITVETDDTPAYDGKWYLKGHSPKKPLNEIAQEVRSERDRRLSACDWTQMSDSPLSSEQKLAWATYRQALRDIPEQTGFPTEILWPEVPNV